MTLEQDIGLLARTRPFDLLPRDALKIVAFAAERKRIAAGESLFNQGDEADCAYFVLSGAVLLSIYGQAGPKEHVAGPGALIGEIAMIAPVTRPSSAHARDDTVALRIPRDVMTRVLAEFPREAALIRASFAKRTKQMVAELSVLRNQAMV
jgi:CRP-like cAMP-binding protein